MEFARSVSLPVPFSEAVARVKAAFSDQGFGTLTEIDVKDTLRQKLGAEVEDYVILGVCNPQLAKRALDVDRRVGTLLPCTVVVRAADGGSEVVALDPQVMVTVPGVPALASVADEAGRRVHAALDALVAS